MEERVKLICVGGPRAGETTEAPPAGLDHVCVREFLDPARNAVSDTRAIRDGLARTHVYHRNVIRFGAGAPEVTFLRHEDLSAPDALSELIRVYADRARRPSTAVRAIDELLSEIEGLNASDVSCARFFLREARKQIVAAEARQETGETTA